MSDTADTADGGATGAGGRRDVTAMLMPELRRVAGGLGIKSAGMKKADLVSAVRAAQGSGAGASRSRPDGAPAQGEAETAPSASAPRRRSRNQETAGVQESPDRDQQEASSTPAVDPSTGRAEEQQDRPAKDQQKARRKEQQKAQDKAQQKEQSDAGKGGDQGGRTKGGDHERQDRQEQPKKQADDQKTAKQGSNQANNQANNQGGDNQRQKNGGGNQSGQGQSGQGQSAQDNQAAGDLDDDGGSRRNRRRRGRDRQVVAAPRGNGGNRNEPDTTILDDDVLLPCAGILDVLDNYAFVRTTGYLPGPDDVYVSLSMVRKLGLRPGDAVGGQVRLPREGERKEKFNPLVKIDSVNGADPELARSRKEFGALTPVFPTERLRLETRPDEMIGRVVDVAAPIGKGQRGLVVSPARAGRTTVLRAIADAVSVNNPECHLMVVLIDERPEEVTEFERSVKGEVISSTFDRPPSDHTAVAELAIERAKRLVELEHDVVVLLDGITTLGRAYNLAAAPSGRTLDGGVDASALYPPKKFFGAARNIENGGSLTIVATATVESGSAMDEVIFEEFEGTATMELRLRRDLADRWIFPAVDGVRSGTRREDLLMGEEEVQIVRKLRRALSRLEPQRGLEMLLARIGHTRTNYELLAQVQRATEAELTTVD